MIQYGYINENGYLVSKQISDRVERYQEETGEIRQRIVSVEEQLTELDKNWKPVDLLDESKTLCENGYVVRIIPFDNDDRISFKYEKVFDKKGILSEIEQLKEILSGGDYRITKCYEASLTGEPLPYDIKSLREERQKVRNRINELERNLSSNI